jgi:hypothetical protein
VEIPTLSDAMGTGSAPRADSLTLHGGRGAFDAPLFPMFQQRMDICHCLRLPLLKFGPLTTIITSATLRMAARPRQSIMPFTLTKPKSLDSLQVDGRRATTVEEQIAMRYGREYAIRAQLSVQELTSTDCPQSSQDNALFNTETS